MIKHKYNKTNLEVDGIIYYPKGEFIELPRRFENYSPVDELGEDLEMVNEIKTYNKKKK